MVTSVNKIDYAVKTNFEWDWWTDYAEETDDDSSEMINQADIMMLYVNNWFQFFKSMIVDQWF